MTKFNYTEVESAHNASQSARVSCLSGFSKVESTITEFTNSPDLTGPGWDSAKQAFSPYQTISKALYNYHCDFGETYTAFNASFESEVGETSKTLDTDDLINLQNQINELQREKQDLLSKIGEFLFGDVNALVKKLAIDSVQKQVDLLEKYQDFENNHEEDFSNVMEIGSELETALKELGKSKQFDASTGTYCYPDYSNSPWYNKLKGYNDSRPSQRFEIVVEDKYGYAIKVYVNGEYNEQATANITYMRSKECMDELGNMLKHLPGEFFGIYDIYRLLTGKDPVTGNDASRIEAALWTALLLLPRAKMIQSVKELRAGDRALSGAALTTKDLEILHKAGYFEDVKKLTAMEKAGKADDIFKRTTDLENHLKFKDPNVPRKRGIGGAHNSDEFFKNDVKVMSQTPTDIPGVTVVEYKIPELDAKGLPTGNYKKTVFKKTIYDPKIFPDEEYIRSGLEAANDAAKKNGSGEFPREWTGQDNSGRTWRGYYKDGEIDSFYPD